MLVIRRSRSHTDRAAGALRLLCGRPAAVPLKIHGQQIAGPGNVGADLGYQGIGGLEALFVAQTGHEVQTQLIAVEVQVRIQQEALDTQAVVPEGGLAADVGHGLQGLAQVRHHHAGGVDARRGQHGVRDGDIGRREAQTGAAAFAVHHQSLAAVGMAQQAGGRGYVALADELAQAGGADHMPAHFHRRQLVHIKAVLLAQGTQHIGLAAAAAPQREVMADDQMFEPQGQQVLPDELLGRQRGQLVGEGQLQHTQIAQALQQAHAGGPAGQGLMRLAEEHARMRPEGDDHAIQAELLAVGQRTADEDLMALVYAVEIADGDGRGAGRRGRGSIHDGPVAQIRRSKMD